jgi:Cof subfamily protein (haloacid dehalogenase superfamily)
MAIRYRLLAVDVDGTLMNTRNELPDAHRAALHRAHEAGLTVCLCTGRTYSEARPVIEAIGLDSDIGIFVFGAVVSRLPAGKTLHRATIAPDVADRLVRHFQHHGYPVLVLYDADQTSMDYRFVHGEQNVDVFERWLEAAPAVVERIDAWHPIAADPVRVGVIDDIANAPHTMRQLADAFQPGELKWNSITAPNYGLHVVECFAPQVSKWHGITRVTESLGIDGSQVAAIGDDVNDLEMIRHAGLSIAMGNAIEPIKAAAHRIAPTNDENGVAAAIEAILEGRW